MSNDVKSEQTTETKTETAKVVPFCFAKATGLTVRSSIRAGSGGRQEQLLK